MLKARNACELAGVIAHEVGHVALRHVANNYNRHRNTQIGQDLLVAGASILGGGAVGVPLLRAALEVFATAPQPGHVEHLPFRWHEEPSETKWHPAEPSPIIAMIKKARAAKAAT